MVTATLSGVLAVALLVTMAASGEVKDAMMEKGEVEAGTDTKAIMVVRPFAVALGASIQIEVTGLQADGRPVTGEVEIAWSAPRQKLSGKITAQLDDRGHLIFPFSLSEKLAEGTVVFTLSHPALAVKPVARVSVHTPEVAKELQELSRAACVPVPCRIAFVGDSLTDMNRGANYVSIVERALRAKYGGQVTVINSGKGGDSIVRIEERLERTVLEHKPDWVFVFVGHNDCKIAWDPRTEDFGKCFVPIEEFAAAYRRVVQRLREGGVKRISLMSISASHEPTTRAVHEAAVKQKKLHNFFGRPDLLEKYNEVIRNVAAEYGLDYLDVYTPMKHSPEWAQLTDSSGVHLREAGDRFIAVQVLRFIAGR